jgi:type II secretory pathway pseudopilin PulG
MSAPRTLVIRRRRSLGFTLVEIMVSLVIFVVAVVGLVAMESRGVEAQRAAQESREAERLAQEVMAELHATSFDELVRRDFANNANPAMPYNDHTLGTFALRDYREAPGATANPGMRREFYWVGRRVGVIDGAPQPNGDPANAPALVLEVDVLWIDHSNAQFPPPAGVTVDDLEPNNLVPGADEFLPFVSGVHLSTVRVNDGASQAVPP